MRVVALRSILSRCDDDLVVAERLCLECCWFRSVLGWVGVGFCVPMTTAGKRASSCKKVSRMYLPVSR